MPSEVRTGKGRSAVGAYYVLALLIISAVVLPLVDGDYLGVPYPFWMRVTLSSACVLVVSDINTMT